MQSCVGKGWRSSGPCAWGWECIAPSDGCALLMCRDLSGNKLSGTLPQEWGAMPKLNHV
jgi:hypothetical protein